jgi:adenylosuccinate lyase
MPHKRNPILSENLTGLARLMRGYALSAFEDVPLWHERDISHSSVERVIGPDATVTSTSCSTASPGLVEQMRVSPSRCARTSPALGGWCTASGSCSSSAAKGVDRQAAYVIVQRNAMRVYEEVSTSAPPLSGQELAKWMTPRRSPPASRSDEHLRHVDDIFARVFGSDARATSAG